MSFLDDSGGADKQTHEAPTAGDMGVCERTCQEQKIGARIPCTCCGCFIEQCQCKLPTNGQDVTKVLNLTGDVEIDRWLTEDVLVTMAQKGHDYTQGNPDRLHNFRTVGDSVGIPMEKAWFTYFYKHYSALVTYIKEGGQSESEPIEGRVKDMVVYLLLFYKMIKTRGREDAPKAAVSRAVDVERDFYALYQQVTRDLSKITGAGPNPAEVEKPLKQLRANPNVVVIQASDGTVEIDRARARKLADLPGVPIDESVARYGAAIVERLDERDRERADAAKGVGFGRPMFCQTYPDPVLDKEALREAMEDVIPLDQRDPNSTISQRIKKEE